MADDATIPENLLRVAGRSSTAKFWITPENRVIRLETLHFEFFRDPTTSSRWGVPFASEIPTRLNALRVGFVRGNYEINGGKLLFESMRFDRMLRNLIDNIVLENCSALDVVRMTVMDKNGEATSHGELSLLRLRAEQRPVNRWTIGSWISFPATRAPGKIV